MVKRLLRTSTVPFKVRASYQGKEPKVYDHPAGRDIELAELMARRLYQSDIGLSRYLSHKIKTEVLGPLAS